VVNHLGQSGLRIDSPGANQLGYSFEEARVFQDQELGAEDFSHLRAKSLLDPDLKGGQLSGRVCQGSL